MRAYFSAYLCQPANFYNYARNEIQRKTIEDPSGKKGVSDVF